MLTKSPDHSPSTLAPISCQMQPNVKMFWSQKSDYEHESLLKITAVSVSTNICFRLHRHMGAALQLIYIVEGMCS